MNDSSFRFIDLFAGIGGMRMAFEASGGKCVFTSEWNTSSQITYASNFDCSGHEIAGDITRIDARDIPEHDVLVAGFPCQPFSIAGVSKKNSLNRPHGFECETQGTLFFDIERILAHHRPQAFLLENVKNLLSHDRGNTMKVILRTLSHKLGYSVDYRVVDAKPFLPQHRERTIIVGFRDNHDFRFDDIDLTSGPYPKLNTILHPEDGSERDDPAYIDEQGKVRDKFTLSDTLWTYLKNYAQKHREKGNGFGYGLVGPMDVARTLSARYYKDGSEILVKREGGNPRRLTPRECSRLMGFEVFGGKRFDIPVSNTQAYKQFGNSVAVPVIVKIAQHMVRVLGNENCKRSVRQLALYAG